MRTTEEKKAEEILAGIRNLRLLVVVLFVVLGFVLYLLHVQTRDLKAEIRVMGVQITNLKKFDGRADERIQDLEETEHEHLRPESLPAPPGRR